MNISDYYSANNIYMVEQVDLPVNPEDLKEEWLLVKCEEQKSLGEVMCVKYKDVQVCCLQISWNCKNSNVKRMQYSTNKSFELMSNLKW